MNSDLELESTLTSERQLDLPEGCPRLTTYYVYLTEGCNLACRHCWLAPAFQKDGGTGGHLDYDLYALAIEEGLPLGLGQIKFTGGEPLLHPDLVRMIDLATEKGLGTYMETNGTLLTRELAFHLKEKTSLYFVSVSLDGATAETHEYMRNVPGCFEQARRGIRYLVEAGYRPQVIFSLHAGNVHEVEPLVRWAEANGCGSVKINLVNNLGRGKQMEAQGDLLSIERLIDIGRWVTSELQPQLTIRIFYGWPAAMWGISALLSQNSGTCQVHNILGILSNGQISMCGIGVTDPDLVYGWLGVDRVASIWAEHPLLWEIREKIPHQMQGVCGDCIHRDLCLGLCPAHTYHETRDFTQPFWFCREASRQGLFPTSRLRS